MTARSPDLNASGPKRTARSTGSASAPPEAGSGFATRASRSIFVVASTIAPAGTLPAAPPPVTYEARTVSRPTGGLRPYSPSPKTIDARPSSSNWT